MTKRDVMFSGARVTVVAGVGGATACTMDSVVSCIDDTCNREGRKMDATSTLLALPCTNTGQS